MFRVNYLLLIIATILASPVFSLSEDSKQPLHIVSDTSIYNYKTGINDFEGHVQVDQGTTHITADKLTTKTNGSRKVQEVVAYGIHDTAHFWTLPKKSKPEMHATANIIKYFPIAGTFALENNAHVTQEKNSFQGQLVLYSMNDQTITVPETTSGRSVLVYNPDEK
jgi:lipopolysaccharide export system protein LptA